MKNFSVVIYSFLILLSTNSKAQDDVENENNIALEKKGLKLGINIGSYFANKYTASIYDGYGFDIDGNKNSFDNSFMYQKIVLQYGGGYGQTDLIAQALSVDHNEWFFKASDMPINMRYNPAFVVGLVMRYSVDDKNSIILNVNGSKLKAYGNFTITTTKQLNTNQLTGNIHTFAIRGAEQRLMFQFGYNRLLGNNEKLNFFVEGGLNITMAKFDSNEILINTLYIDLTTYYDYPGYPTYRTRKPIGTGFGAFAGLGIHLNISPKWLVQLGYNPTYEGINIGVDPKLKLQHTIGLKAYYKL